jgi:hypothetical protein
MLKEGEYYIGPIKASQLVAKSNYVKNDGTTLARKIKALFRHFQRFGRLLAKTRGSKRKGGSYLDNEDVF